MDDRAGAVEQDLQTSSDAGADPVSNDAAEAVVSRQRVAVPGRLLVGHLRLDDAEARRRRPLTSRVTGEPAAMLNRRQLLLAGLAAPGALFAARPPATRASGASPATGCGAGSPALRRVLVDRRHADSRDYGRQLEWQGVRAVEFDGDVSAVWRDVLAPAIFASGGALAGMTTPTALCCLERIAADRGLRVVWRECDAAADTAWRHSARAADAAPRLRWVIAAV